MLDEAREQGLELATLPDALERFEPCERPLAASTWGIPKDLTTWDSPLVADLAFSARRAELRTVAAASAGGGDPRRGSALARAARELLALQASDWAFLATRDLAADYPWQRVRAHAAAHDAALAALTDSGLVPDASAHEQALEPGVRHLAPYLDLSPLVAP